MSIVFHGTSRDDKYNADGGVFDYRTELYGNGGDDELIGSLFNTNFIYGGTGSDTLEGGADTNNIYGDEGNDTITVFYLASTNNLYGGSGNDYIDGGDGGSYINGGRGSDTLVGGDGGDTYVVNSTKDKITETYTPYYDNDLDPIDTVRASVSWKLAENLEDLVLTGSSKISGTGNSDNNSITGNSGNNALKGLSGRDKLLGGGGADRLEGGSGRDRLDGQGGRDRLDGGDDSVSDVFIFSTIKDSRVGSKHDTILNFKKGIDKIDLHALDADAETGRNNSFDWKGTSALDHSVWWKSSDNGVLVQGDVNGNSKADFEIFVQDVTRLSSDDFIL